MGRAILGESGIPHLLGEMEIITRFLLEGWKFGYTNGAVKSSFGKKTDKKFW